LDIFEIKNSRCAKLINIMFFINTKFFINIKFLKFENMDFCDIDSNIFKLNNFTRNVDNNSITFVAVSMVHD